MPPIIIVLGQMLPDGTITGYAPKLIRNGVWVKIKQYYGCFRADLYELAPNVYALMGFSDEIIPCPVNNFDYVINLQTHW